jgi:8-oxo-dGTP pyrophosphatase MutT (NUDIX family)
LPQRRFSPSRELHRNPFETVRQVHADFDGFSKDYYVVEYGARAGVVAVRDGCILLTAQYRFLIDRESWELPGGKVDDDEDPVAAAERECLEETGMRCQDLQLLLEFRPGIDNVENQNFIYWSEKVREERSFVSDPAEALALAWVPVEDCVRLALDRRLGDCMTVAGVLGYACLRARR